MRAHGVEDITIVNVEPYPSERVASDPGADPIVVANPAESDFMQQSGMEAHSMDEVIAVFSVPTYLGSEQEVTTLFGTIKQLLKPGGCARIGHLGVVDALPGDPRLSAIMHSLKETADEGYLLEAVDVRGTTTLMMTAPESTSNHQG